MRSRYDWLVVGAGLTGAVFAERIASQLGQRVLVIDRRTHIGGNSHDARDGRGVLCHRYGPHIFHTNSAAVVRYLSGFTRWRRYEHRSVASIGGRLVPIPFNLDSLDACLPPGRAVKIAEKLLAAFGPGAQITLPTLRESDDGALRDLGRFIHDAVFRDYNLKQWGRPLDSLDASVAARLPIRVDRDGRLFRDRFQQMPSPGYTAMFERILSARAIDVRLGCDLTDLDGSVTASRVLHTGGIDEYFGHCLGALPYRSVHFDFRTYSRSRILPCGIVTFPDDAPFTRISEACHLTGESGECSTLCFEYPREYRPGIDEPCYPIPARETRELHAAYLRLAAAEAPHVVFAGRLADYRYINMDQAVGRALTVFRRVASGLPSG